MNQVVENTENIDVPQVDLNTPLPNLEIVGDDLLMNMAKKEWKMGVLVFAIFVVCLILVFVWHGQSKTINNDLMQTASATPSISPSPVAISEPNLSISVLNGSGITGAARKLADKIENAGYTVAETANAKEIQDGNVFEISKNIVLQKEKLLEDLKRIGFQGEVRELDENTSYNVKLIIGK